MYIIYTFACAYIHTRNARLRDRIVNDIFHQRSLSFTLFYFFIKIKNKKHKIQREPKDRGIYLTRGERLLFRKYIFTYRTNSLFISFFSSRYKIIKNCLSRVFSKTFYFPAKFTSDFFKAILTFALSITQNIFFFIFISTKLALFHS